jgi:ActR/RegA family two-component response regulator
VDDDETFCKVLKSALEKRNYEVLSATDVASGMALAEHSLPEYAVIDLRIGFESGLELVKKLISLDDNTRIVMLTGFASIATAVEAIKLKAIDFFLKPYEPEDLDYAIERAVGLARMRRHEQPEESREKPQTGDLIVVWDKDRILPIDIEKIVKIKSSGAYSEIYLDSDKHYVSAKNLGTFEDILKHRQFVRIHRSCLVNIDHVKYYNPGARAFVTLSDSKIEYVSKRKKRDLLKYFNAD